MESGREWELEMKKGKMLWTKKKAKEVIEKGRERNWRIRKKKKR